MDEEKILSINEFREYTAGASLTFPEDIKNMSKLTSKLPNFMESFMEQLKVFSNLIYALFTASCLIFLELKAIIRSLMEYNTAAQTVIKRKQRSAIAWIITLQTKHFFCGESNLLTEFVLIKNNLRAQNILIDHAEVPIALYGGDSLTAAGKKR